MEKNYSIEKDKERKKERDEGDAEKRED